MAKERTEEEEFEFNWVQARNDAGLGHYDQQDIEEGGVNKFLKKFKEEPLVPIGCFATAACLTAGLLSMRSGNMRMSQIMMRSRVIAQGLTVVAIVSGITYKATQQM